MVKNMNQVYVDSKSRNDDYLMFYDFGGQGRFDVVKELPRMLKGADYVLAVYSAEHIDNQVYNLKKYCEEKFKDCTIKGGIIPIINKLDKNSNVKITKLSDILELDSVEVYPAIKSSTRDDSLYRLNVYNFLKNKIYTDRIVREDKICKVYKIILVGEGGVGKTNIVRVLTSNLPFNPNGDKLTVGINLEFPDISWTAFNRLH